jgi:hypothetical protein
MLNDKWVTVGVMEQNWNGISIGSELITFSDDSPSRYKSWLIKGMYGLLIKWGAIKVRQVGHQMTYKHVEINYKHLTDYLYRHTSALECMLSQEIDYIIVGSDAMAALQLEWINKPYSFTLPDTERLDMFKGAYHWSLAGYRVRCIPWFRGVVVVPKDVAKL